MEKQKIIALCGSAKFKDEFLKEQKRLTEEGNLVLIPNFSIDVEKLDNSQLNALKEEHLKRIERADEIFVINKDNYIGKSTLEEIKFAIRRGKRIKFLVNSKVIDITTNKKEKL